MQRYTDAFREQLGLYITWLQLQLEIVDWRINLSEESVADDGKAWASMECTYGRRVATLRLCHDFFDVSPDDQRHSLVHEMIHVVVEDLDDVVFHSDLNITMGMPAYTVFAETYRRTSERLVDHLAYVLDEAIADFPNGNRLWENVLRAERGELPLPSG